MKKIGVLLPQSNNFPKMGKDFINGLKLSLKDNYELKIEGIGLGTNSKDVINSLQKLINQENVIVTTGLLGHNNINDVYDFMESIEEPLIYSDLGATIPLSLNDKKYVYCNSFDICQSANVLGQYFLNNQIKNIGTSSCYYEAGYGILEAFEMAIAEKGNFTGHFITPLHPRENESSLMFDFFGALNSDVIFAFHNGIYANEHAVFLKENKLNTRVPLYTTYFSTENAVLNNNLEVFDGVKSIATWFDTLDTVENNLFVKNYEEKHGQKPSVFALLGYENGLLIDSYLEKNNIHNPQLVGPRGIACFDSETHRTNNDHYIYEIKYDDGYTRKLITTLKNTNPIQITTNKTTGWHNAYLCH